MRLHGHFSMIILAGVKIQSAMKTSLHLPVLLLSFGFSFIPKKEPVDPVFNETVFTYLTQSIRAREAFSPIKNARLNINLEASFVAEKQHMVQAKNRVELFYSIVRLSNLRKDHHLKVQPSFTDEDLRIADPHGYYNDRLAPVKFQADYETETFFVGDVAANYPTPDGAVNPEPGDALVQVNGMDIKNYFTSVEPYINYSSRPDLLKSFTRTLGKRIIQIPHVFYRDSLHLVLQKASGKRYPLTMPYVDKNDVKWEDAEPYAGYTPVMKLQNFKVLMPQARQDHLLIQWLDFESDLFTDVDSLMNYAARHGLLNKNIILDFTQNGGGSKGIYALRRLTPKPFRSMYGDLRISDITEAFMLQALDRVKYEAEREKSVAPEYNPGSYLPAWFSEVVQKDIENKKEYTKPVPFKLQFQAHNADERIRPAPQHFTGKLIAFIGPNGGSHVDQIAATIVDNKLGHAIGMPCGGYSNSWEWKETIKDNADEPVCTFMWSIGHSFRANGEILEGNPARPHDFVPFTRSNFKNYNQILLQTALERL